MSEDLTHHSDLVAPFRSIVLVYTQRIYPKRRISTKAFCLQMYPELNKSLEEILRNGLATSSNQDLIARSIIAILGSPAI
jgi:hypothetical protein